MSVCTHLRVCTQTHKQVQKTGNLSVMGGLYQCQGPGCDSIPKFCKMSLMEETRKSIQLHVKHQLPQNFNFKK